MKYGILILLLSISCGIFEPREPEEPGQSGTNFLPANSPQILLENFTSSFNSKSTDNYITCFSETGIGGLSDFDFIPSADAGAAYQSIFNDWDIEKERQFFVSMISNFDEGINPSMNLFNGSFDLLSPDSAIYVTDYNINVRDNIEDVPNTYTGTMQLTMYPKENNIWCILRWIDLANTEIDTNLQAFSFFKAQIFNR